MATLYSGGLVFDGTGKLLENHGLVVEGDRVVAIAPLGEFDGFDGDRVDTSGATVMPGLFDCHVHLCMDGAPDPFASIQKLDDAHVVTRALMNAQTSLRGGITTLRDCGGKDYLEFAVRDACNSRTFPGPNIYAAGRMICMTGGHGHIAGARSIPGDQLATDTRAFDKLAGKTLILYCDSGTTTAAALRTLARAGFKDAVALRGGLSAWKQENLPVVKD